MPDVAADADPATSITIVAVLDGRAFLGGASGTSAGAPVWSALAALADQDAGRRLGVLNPPLCTGLRKIPNTPWPFTTS